jgi:hypothetical protein
MTARKDHLRLFSRTPAYVDRESGAAELRISPATWDRYVAEGRIPPPAPGFPADTPRWRWEDVDNKLAGRVNAGDDIIVAAGRLKHGKKTG